MSTVKQVIVMRTDLGMRKGKMIAQGAHASMAVFLKPILAAPVRRMKVNGPREATFRMGYSAEDPKQDYLLIGMTPLTQEWLHGTFTKVCVRVDSEEELRALHKQAEDAGLLCSLIIDSGKTEFHGEPTVTCCAIGPAESEDIDPITGSLRLL